MKTKLQNVVRKDSLSRFGFGTDAMKKLSVCPNCHSLENSDNSSCSICGTKLAKTTLYDLYKSKHGACPECGALIGKGMQFCPQCGKILKIKTSVCSV